MNNSPTSPKTTTVPTPAAYQLPPSDLLEASPKTIAPAESKAVLRVKAQFIQDRLMQFGIQSSQGDIIVGPTFTRYELQPGPWVKLENILNLSRDLAAALEVERLNILAPVPGKSTAGIEVPNVVRDKVLLRDVFESLEWQHCQAILPLALGKDGHGQPVIADLAKMPHCLVGGRTGSGKSVCLHSLITSLLYHCTPDDLCLLLIDPQVVELQQYQSLPHLVMPVVTKPQAALSALRWVIKEIETRREMFARVFVRNIKSFNEQPSSERMRSVSPDSNIPKKLPRLVVIITELSDLMREAPADVEQALARITQMAQPVGVHCLIATQRPAVDVITGVIKANIPARIAFQVGSRVDSRTILDAMGANELLGRGDMLYLPAGAASLKRIQGAFITDEEIQAVVDFIAARNNP